MELQGSKTAKNLMTAFAGESMARNRYTYFSAKARAEGFIEIAAIFEETAGHEREHAKRLFKFMTGGDGQVNADAAYPFGVIGITADNLQAAAGGEHYEAFEMYPSFARVAEEEGFHAIAEAMFSIAEAEKYHERRYLSYRKEILDGLVFKRPESVTWRCRNCGYHHVGKEALEVCPACAHPRAHFEVVYEKF